MGPLYEGIGPEKRPNIYPPGTSPDWALQNLPHALAYFCDELPPDDPEGPGAPEHRGGTGADFQPPGALEAPREPRGLGRHPRAALKAQFK